MFMFWRLIFEPKIVKFVWRVRMCFVRKRKSLWVVYFSWPHSDSSTINIILKFVIDTCIQMMYICTLYSDLWEGKICYQAIQFRVVLNTGSFGIEFVNIGCAYSIATPSSYDAISCTGSVFDRYVRCKTHYHARGCFASRGGRWFDYSSVLHNECQNRIVWQSKYICIIYTTYDTLSSL